MSLFPRKRRLRERLGALSFNFVDARPNMQEIRRLGHLALVFLSIGVPADTLSTILFTTKCGWWSEASYAKYVILYHGIPGLVLYTIETNLVWFVTPILSLIWLKQIIRHDHWSIGIAIILFILTLVGAIHLIVVPGNLVFWSLCQP